MEDSKNKNNRENSRRKFLQQRIIAGAGLMLAPALMSVSTKEFTSSEINKDRKDKMATRNLGKLNVSALGAGCMSQIESVWRKNEHYANDFLPIISA